MGTYGDTGDYPDAGTLTGTETLLVDDGADTLSTTVQTIANLATNASNLTSGTVADARIASTIARDSEVTSAISTHSGDTDPHGDRAYADSAVSTHSSDTTSVHGIADTSALATDAEVTAAVSAHAGATDPHGDRAYTDSSIGTHSADTTSVHGIADTSALLDTADIGVTVEAAGAATTAVSTHVAASDPHGDRAYAAGLVDDLSGVSNASTARSNLGLGGAATLSVGTTTGTVAAGDDSRITSAASLGLAYAISQSVFTP